VQDFTPTPMTVATEIYATGVHPYTQKPMNVAKTPEDKQEQRSFFFWYKPEMKGALRATLKRLGMSEAAAKLLGGESAKTTMMVDGECSIRNGTGATPGERSSYQMIRASDTAKIRPARQLAPKAGKPWFQKKKHR
jgi:hypothetical protein